MYHRDDISILTESAYKKHGKMVFSVCLRILGDRHLAEDALQSTFLIFMRKSSELSKLADLGGWFYRSAYFIAYTMRRDRIRLQKQQKEFQLRMDSDSDLPENERTWKSIQEELDPAIMGLKDSHRRLIQKLYFEGYSQNEAAKVLGIPAGTLRRQLSEAISKLRRNLAHKCQALEALFLSQLLRQYCQGIDSPPFQIATSDKQSEVQIYTKRKAKIG